MIDNGDGASATMPALTHVAVDLNGLADFATLVRDETEANLSPYADRIIADQVQGVCFGTRSASAELQAARRSYHDCLGRSVAAMRSYVEASRFLVTAIETVAERYASADALSAERADRVAKDLVAAVDAAEAAHARAEADARAVRAEQEVLRRDERMLRWEAP